MKRLLLFITTLAIANFSLAQTLTTNPEVFTAEDQVTFTFDVSGTDLANLSEAWVWTWAPDYDGEAIPSNVNPANSDPSATDPAKLTKSGSTFVITFRPIDLIKDIAPQDLTRMGILLKGNDWPDGQTSDFLLNVQAPGFFVAIQQPSSNPVLANVNESITFTAIASEPSVITLLADGVELASQAGVTEISASFSSVVSGSVELKAIANNGTETKEQSLIAIFSEGQTLPLPAGIQPGINYHDGDATKVTLALIAPGKNQAFVIGDFNEWEINASYRMNRTPDGEHFWLEVSGLEAQKEYVFQYLVDGIRIADPFTDKVSDPYDDQYIPSSTYPDLIQYPQGKTDFRASVLQTGQEDYQWEVTDFQKPAKEKLVIYELLVRDFTDNDEIGTYQGVLDKLDYIENLGVNAIEFMPLNEFEGNDSWGYNPNFYFAPDKAYGPKNKLKELIDECHKRGIAVILDMVLNHSYGSSPMVRLYEDSPGSYSPGPNNPWFNDVDNFENPGMQFGPDLNHESPYTQSLVDRITAYWLTEYKFDGFRFDLTKGFTNDKKGQEDWWGSLYDADRVRLLKRMTDKIKEVDPNAFVIFEHLADNEEEKELADYGIMMWGNINHDFRTLIKGSNANIEWAMGSTRGWNDPFSLISYMESHDEERLVYDALENGISGGNYVVKGNLERSIERAKMAASLYFLMPGPKMIWQFGELGYDFSINLNGRVGRKPVPWDPQYDYYNDPHRLRLYKVYSALAKLANEYDAFDNGTLNHNLNANIKYLSINGSDLKAVVLANFSTSNRSVSAPFPSTGTWYDYFSGEDLSVESTDQSFVYRPGEFHVYVDRPVDFPEQGLIGEEIVSGFDNIEEIGFSMFPNPSNGRLFFHQLGTKPVDSIKLYDLTGKLVYFQNDFDLKGKTIQVDLPSSLKGMHLVEIEVDGHAARTKVLVE